MGNGRAAHVRPPPSQDIYIYMPVNLYLDKRNKMNNVINNKKGEAIGIK